MNNSVAMMIDILNINYSSRGELVNNIASGLFTTCMALGEAIGPVTGSVTVSLLGGFVNAFCALNVVFVILSVSTAYHLAGKYVCLGHSPNEPIFNKIHGSMKKIIMVEGQEGKEYARLENNDDEQCNKNYLKVENNEINRNNVNKSYSHSSYDEDQNNLNEQVNDLKKKLLE